MVDMRKFPFLVFAILTALFAATSCGGGDDDDDSSPPVDDSASADDAGDDDQADDADDDSGDDSHDDSDDDDDDSLDDADDDSVDDTAADDTADDDTEMPPPPNPNAKADAFRLFYKERAERTILAFNRHAMAGDAVFATTFNKMAIAKTGDDWEVVPGPTDNNAIGMSTYATWKLYQAIGGRKLELSLIRMFEGLAFNEAVTGHSGITVREALPGWRLVLDGIAGTVERTRDGNPVTTPWPYAPELEQEILDTFYSGVVFTYRNDPLEYYFNLKAINELNDYALTWVFDGMPDFLRISNCCSSWMISKKGEWTGSFWGNHNSRDNFTDYAMGYLAAFEAESLESQLPDDLAAAAIHAANAARLTGDRIVSDDNIQMTVPEGSDYEVFVPGGQVRPDGMTEWQDLGSLASCQMAYLASAISTNGLSAPVPVIPLPGAIETSAIKLLFDMLGITLPPPAIDCRSVDDAFFGATWTDIMNYEVLGVPWYDIAKAIAGIWPDLFPSLVGSAMDDFKELQLGAVGLSYYSRQTGDTQLFEESRQALKSLIEMQRVLAELVYGLRSNPDSFQRIAQSGGAAELDRVVRDATEMLYYAATYARMFDIYSPLDDFQGFADEEAQGNYLMSWLSRSDTASWTLLSDEEIQTQITQALSNTDSWIQQRYTDRFGDTFPIRRAGDGYECIQPGDVWGPTENPHHDWFGGFRLWFTAPLCVFATDTLDCSWAKLGCAPADLDGSGAVDAADLATFGNAWTTWGEGATCSAGNAWCDGADLDRNGSLDTEDQGYMNAAQGCTV
jgi:hypothetical protein